MKKMLATALNILYPGVKTTFLESFARFSFLTVLPRVVSFVKTTRDTVEAHLFVDVGIANRISRF